MDGTKGHDKLQYKIMVGFCLLEKKACVSSLVGMNIFFCHCHTVFLFSAEQQSLTCISRLIQPRYFLICQRNFLDFLCQKEQTKQLRLVIWYGGMMLAITDTR